MIKFSSLRVGQAVKIGSVCYRVFSKLSDPDNTVIKFADAMGNIHLAYNRDFDLYVNSYIERYNQQHKDNPLPYPVGHDGKAFRWADWFQKIVSPRLFVTGRGTPEDQQTIKDELIHEMLFTVLGHRNVLEQFAAKAKSLGVNRQNGAAKLTDFLISTFMYRIDEMQNKLKEKNPEEEISMYQPAVDDDGMHEQNILDTEEYAIHDEEFQSTEARHDVAAFREGFREWLLNKPGLSKGANNLLLMFDIFWQLVKGVNNPEDVKRNDLQEEWMKETGLSFGLFKRYLYQLPDMIERYVATHRAELGDTNIFVSLVDMLRAERQERKQLAIPAMVSSLHLAVGIEEDLEEAALNSVSPLKEAGDLFSDNGPQEVRRIKRITSHVGLSRYMDTLEDTGAEIAKIKSIPSPYAYSPTHTLYRTSDGMDVIIVETAHKQYDVFAVPKSTPKLPKEASSKIAQTLIRGDHLTPEQVKQVEMAFIYRWTKENNKRGDVYHCDKCDVRNNPYVNETSAEGHQHPTIPLQTDAEWFKDHAFYFTNAGKLLPNMHAQPSYLAPEDEAHKSPVLATVAHRFAMEKSRKNAMLGHLFNNADGQAIRDETLPNGRLPHVHDDAELRQNRVSAQMVRAHEEWQCEDCGNKGELNPKGGRCSTCGSQAVSPVRNNIDPTLQQEKRTPFRETDPETVRERSNAIRERQRFLSSDKTAEYTQENWERDEATQHRLDEVDEAEERGDSGGNEEFEHKNGQGSGGTTVTYQNQNVTDPNSPAKGEAMTVPDAIDQQSGPHSPNAPATAPRTPTLQPRVVNTPAGTPPDATDMASTASLEDPEDISCPECHGHNIDIDVVGDEGYKIYCEDCEDVTFAGGLRPGSPVHDYREVPGDEFERLDMDAVEPPEEAPFEHEAADTGDVYRGDHDPNAAFSDNAKTPGQNSGEVIKDDSGKPVTFYHGTRENFDKFENKPGKNSTIFGSEPVQRSGIFFTPDKEFAEEFHGGKGVTKEVHLSLSKPADFTKSDEKLDTDLINNGINERFLRQGKVWEWFDGENGVVMREALQKSGYDGAIIEESDDSGKTHKSYIVFDPKQIEQIKQPEAAPALEQNKPLKKWFGDSKVVDKAGNPHTLPQPNQTEEVPGNYANEPEIVFEESPEESFEEHEAADESMTEVPDRYWEVWSQEQKEAWLVAHDWIKDESWHGGSWWMGKPMWSRKNHEEDIPYQDTDDAIDKELDLIERQPTANEPDLKQGAGSNSGQDDARGVGELYRENFYEHRTKGLSTNGMLSGMKEGSDTLNPDDEREEERDRQRVEFMQMSKYMDSLDWMGKNPWYPKQYPRTSVRLFSDGWAFYTLDLASNNEKKEAEGQDLVSLKKYLSRYNLEKLRTGYREPVKEFTDADKVLMKSMGIKAKTKEKTAVPVAPPAAPVVSPNVQQNMNLNRPAPPPQPGAPVAIMPGEEDQGGERRRTVEPELMNAKYYMMATLIASEEKRLIAEELGDEHAESDEQDPDVRVNEYLRDMAARGFEPVPETVQALKKKWTQI